MRQPKRAWKAATQSVAISFCARRSDRLPEQTSSCRRFSRRSFSASRTRRRRLGEQIGSDVRAAQLQANEMIDLAVVAVEVPAHPVCGVDGVLRCSLTLRTVPE